MKKKIIVISMIKNEADIIESFVRHSLTFADMIIIADHCSGDKTTKILDLLYKEGLPIYVVKYNRVELAHAEVMNSLLHRAFKEFDADFVLPIDGDEFLVNTDTNTPCRNIIESLSTDCLYQLNWRTYEPIYPYEDENKFLLSRPCRRGRDFAVNQKLIVGKYIALKEGFTLGQGCHFAYWKKNNNEIPRVIVPYMHIAHFHWRSNEQYAAKVATSWINNVAKYSVNTITADYLRNCYERLAEGEEIHPGTVIKNPEIFDLRPYCQNITLCYSDDVRPVPMRNLMKASVLMAEAYLEEKILKRKKKITIILPYTGDDTELQYRLHKVKKQNYPYIEIFICCFSKMNTLPNILGEVLEEAEILKNSNLYELTTRANGEYVIYVMPGESIEEDTIIKMISCAESQDQYYMLIFYAKHWQSSLLTPFSSEFAVKEFKGLMATNTINYILGYGQYPAGEMSGVLIRRNLIESCNWLQNCFSDGKPLYCLIWARLLHETTLLGNAIGVLPDNSENTPKTRGLSIDDIVWHQLEWYAIMHEYKDVIPPDIYKCAQNTFQRNKKELDKWRKKVSSALWKVYEKSIM